MKRVINIAMVAAVVSCAISISAAVVPLYRLYQHKIEQRAQMMSFLKESHRQNQQHVLMICAGMEQIHDRLVAEGRKDIRHAYQYPICQWSMVFGEIDGDI